MILYHGSNVEIKTIDLSKSKPYKDFGRGFYLSADRKQAIRMAEQRFQLRRFKVGAITIERLVEELKYSKGITFQYFFGTELAISKLKKL